VKKSINQLESTNSKLLAGGSFLVSIFMLSGVVTDPVNAPKLFILGTFGFSALLVVILFSVNWLLNSFRLPFFSAILFIAASLNAFIFASGPWSQTLYGNYGRNTGFLSYIAFVAFFLLAISCRQKKSFDLLLQSLFTAGVVNVAYCAWVFLFGDFMAWNNTYNTFLGTFGNPNFIGSFLSIFASVVFAKILSPDLTNKSRYLLCGLFVLAVLEMLKTNVMQGKIVLAIGILLVLGFYLRSKTNNNPLMLGYVLFVLIIGSLSILAMLQKGPLTNLIYQYTVSLRGQYWKAGINTGFHNLLNGVGFDGLGDWYRRMRSAKALVTPGVDVTINTSHNVFIDMFAFGGLPLFFSYLLIVAFTLYRIIIVVLKNKLFDVTFVSLVVAWMGYQAQSLISINQIGLAIWGWVLSGGIIGYSKLLMNKEDITSAKNEFKNSKSGVVHVTPNLIAGIGMIIGAIIAVPPLSSDMNYYSSQVSQSAEKLRAATRSSYMHPQNTSLLLSSIISFEQAGLHDLAYQTAQEALKFNPNSFETWKVFYFLLKSSPQDKENAVENLRRLDPLNQNVTAAPR